MKINYSMYSTGLTGGVRTFFEISNCLVDRGHEVTLTTPCVPRYASWFKPKAKINVIKNYALIKKMSQLYLGRLGGWAQKVNLAILEDQMRILAQQTPDCDINVATYCYTAFAVHRSGKGIPFYHIQHYEPLFFKDPYGLKMVEETYFIPLNKIVNSTWLQNQLREKLGIGNTSLVSHAIDHSVFYPRKRKKNSKLRIISLGKNSDWKGINDLFSAMEMVFAQRSDVEWVLYGGHQLPAQFSKVPHRFVLFPTDKELAELYCESDLVVCPSWYESFPLPPLEGMACGIPVITTPFGTEDYAIDNETAVIVPPKSPLVLAQAILALLEEREKRARLAEAGINMAKRFTWEATADKVEKLFITALQNR